MLEETRTAISIQTTAVYIMVQYSYGGQTFPVSLNPPERPTAMGKTRNRFQRVCRFKSKTEGRGGMGGGRIYGSSRKHRRRFDQTRARLCANFSQLNHFYRPGTSVIW